METVKLNSGFEMPIIGLGTFLLTPDEAENSSHKPPSKTHNILSSRFLFGCFQFSQYLIIYISIIFRKSKGNFT